MASSTSKTLTQKDRSSLKSYRDMGYREKPATPNSPSGTTVTTMYDHLLSPPSPAEEEEKNERLRNDLLDEICNDMGIDDSMDLDFDDDFCYNGQQKPGQRLAMSGASAKACESDARRTSANSSSGYATSDSLCAIAKLTHSIPHENNSASDVEAKQRRESLENASVKQEPTSQTESELRFCNVNDTDQGKAAAAAAAANKLAMQRQLSETAAEAKRKESDGMSQSELAEPGCSSSELQGSSTQQSLAGQNRGQPPQQQPPQQQYVDYSYQDDYAMEDMTAPDTMINFSELPQQPNYYQCPQTAQDNLALGFNMSLHQSSHPSFSQPQPFTPHQYSMSNAGRGAGGLWGVPGQPGVFNGSDMSRSSTQQLLQMHSSFQGTSGPMHPFQSYPGAPQVPPSPSANSQPSFQRSESFPGAQVSSNSFGAVPGVSHSQPGAPQQPHTASSPGSASQKSSTPAPPTPIAVSSACLTSFSTASTNNKQIFMRQLVADNKSNAFRSHPLFPLLRDLIIADMNYDSPGFPHSLIRNLPPDFNKLLRNYQSRNPDMEKHYHIPSVNSVVMDALNYAHHSLMDKIRQKKTTVDVGQRSQPVTAPSLTQEGTAMSSPAILASSMTRKPLSSGEYCEDLSKHDISKGPNSYGVMQSPVTGESFRPRRESGSVYNCDMAPPTPGSTYSQPLSVDTGCNSPNSSRHPVNLSTTSQPPTPLYNPAQGTPHQYHHHPQSGFSRPGHPPNPRNPYMTVHGGPPCPPPNYTVSPNNPPLSRHQQTMYELGLPPSGPGMYADPNSYHDPYNNCMPPPPAAHISRLHQMGPDRHLLYMNNINDGSLVKTMIESGKDMYDTLSEAGSVMSAHSMQGSIKGQAQGQGKTTEGRKHASLPKEAVNIMLNWLREHQEKPYPNDDEKGMLIKQTGLTITQINYWFTNARRRLLPKWKGEDM